MLLSAGRQVEFRGESWTMKAPLVENEEIHLGRNLERLQLTSLVNMRHVDCLWFVG